MDRYLGGEEVALDTLVADLETAVARGTFYPVLPVCAAHRRRRRPSCWSSSSAAFPSPLEHPLPTVTTPDGDPREPLQLRPGRAAGRRGGQDHHRPVRRPAQPGAGVLRHPAPGLDRARLRPLRPVRRHDRGPRRPRRGRAGRRAVPARSARRCAPVPRRRSPATSARSPSWPAPRPATRCPTRTTPALMEPWVHARAAAAGRDRRPHQAPTRTSSPQGLARLVAEDPTLRLENNPETHQVVLWTMGEAHVDVLLDRLRTRYGVDGRHRAGAGAAARDVRRHRRSGHGRHVKQSGGHGQYAVCDIEVEPLPPGSGLRVRRQGRRRRRCPASSSRASRRACGPRWSAGVVAGYPVVDIRVTLVDGKAHSVDSCDMAFQTAGALALREAAAAAGGGAARADGRGRGRGRRRVRRGGDERPVDPARPGARAPSPVGAGRTDGAGRGARRSRSTRYAIDLRSLSHGTGTLHPRAYLRLRADARPPGQGPPAG